MLLGISIVQLYIYHLSFPRERWMIQTTVYTIFALDIFQSVVVGASAWQTLCTGWGRPINLQFPGWTFTALPIVSSIVAAWVQIFYAWRIWQLGRWRIVPCAIIVVALAQTGGACAIGIQFIWLHNIERLHDTNMYARTIIWLGGGALADVMIMTSMVYLLYAARRRSRVERSGRMINRLIRLTVETGTACAFSAILELGFFLGIPQTNLHLLIALMLSKVYSNTLMTSLNSRADISVNLRSQLAGSTGTSYTSGISFGFGSSGRSPPSSGWSPRTLEDGPGRKAVIHITREDDSGGGSGDFKDKGVSAPLKLLAAN
ncbi:hypothetical protein OF83DRAFT_761819 [Amylostereum chailletii]|nr:hypothetical protein OF83DRAFT_761819 [Amylostereum chailletii]